MAQIVQWQANLEASPCLTEVMDALAKGLLIGLPTETVYGVAGNAFLGTSIERIQSSKARTEGKPLTIAVPDYQRARECVPDMTALGRRLAQRGWPGPLTIVFQAGLNGGLLERLPDPVRRRVCPDGTLGLRVPDHPVAREILTRSPAPLVLTSANRAGEPPAVSSEQVVQSIGEELAFVIDGGPRPLGVPSTVVGVTDNEWRVLREGAMSRAELAEKAACRILFVCTGNTCRSPMAAALCKKLLAEQLHCDLHGLIERGFFVHSAGITAMMGLTAAPEAVQAVSELGADLRQHQSQPLTEELLEQADYVIIMTRGHLYSLLAEFGSLGPAPRLLSRAGVDLADPIGCEQSVYRDCAAQIERDLQELIPEILRTCAQEPAGNRGQ
jgi:protein-tyrosine phosphatase